MEFLYLAGIDVKTNRSEAMRLFKSAAQRGDPTAQFYLGLMYFTGICISRRYENAFTYFMAAARVANYMALQQITKKKMVESKHPKINVLMTQKVKVKAKEIQMEIFKNVLQKKSETFLGRDREYEKNEVNVI